MPSVCRMASFLCGHEVFQISASASYGVPEFKADLLSLYAKTGSKGTKVTFLLTDTNIVNERFLVFINDLLSTGYIADLCTPVRTSPSPPTPGEEQIFSPIIQHLYGSGHPTCFTQLFGWSWGWRVVALRSDNLHQMLKNNSLYPIPPPYTPTPTHPDLHAHEFLVLILVPIYIFF